MWDPPATLQSEWGLDRATCLALWSASASRFGLRMEGGFGYLPQDSVSVCLISSYSQQSLCSSLLGLPISLLQPSVSPACSARSAQRWPCSHVYFHSSLRLTSALTPEHPDGLGATPVSSCLTCTPFSKTHSLR